MPRRKKLPKMPDFTGIPKDECKLVVQKSNPLKSLSETGMSLVEFKILDAYLSRIDTHDEEKRFVRFEKGELEKILGVKRILKDDLDARLDGLFKVVTIRDKHKNKGFTKIALFEKAEAKQDDDGLWQVDLACTPSAMEYIFNIEVMGYLPYMLKNIIELTSRYSYVLYLYLESRKRGKMSKTWTVSLDELKEMLRCTADSYSVYKEFNDKILKRCHKELNEKTDLRFSYEPIKKGRKVTDIRFTLETIADSILASEPLPEQLTLEMSDTTRPDQSEETEKEVDYGSELADLLGDAALDNEFSPEQVRVIQDLILKIVPSRNHLDICNYLIERVHIMNAYNPKKDRRFAYLCKMLEKEVIN
jgi:plasmid replication initiation protein